MNTRHFIYAIEVEKTGSITQAADNLFMSQPTLSKAIKDLEETLGFAVFKRTSRGVVPTRKGAEFLIHAKKIAGHIEKMALALQMGEASRQTFSIAIPRAGYIAETASRFISGLDLAGDMEFDILETNSRRAIDAVAGSHFVLGIIRYHPEDEEYFLRSLAEKGLQHQFVWESAYAALMREDHPLADHEELTPEDLTSYIEVAFGDDDVPYVRVSDADAGAPQGGRRALVYSRATQLDLLRSSPLAYTLASPVSADVLRGSGLVQRPCVGCGRFRDVLISRNGYRFSSLDQAFLARLTDVTRG